METGRLDPRLIQAILQSVYRLFRVGTFHALDNQAVDISVQTTLTTLRSLDQFESEGITFIFADDTCIVNGQLLRAPPDVYDAAMAFSAFLTRLGVNSISIAKAVREADLRRMLAMFVEKENPAAFLNEQGFLTRNIRLRLVNPNLLLGLEDERLSVLERVLLTYALAVLVLRRLYSAVEGGSFDVAGYFKRMARQLSTVNYADRPAIFDVIMAPQAQPDEARIAVNSAIIAVAMSRRLTDHDAVLSRMCMGALLLDIGKHRASVVSTTGGGNDAVSTAVLHMAMGSLRGDSVERTIITYEATALLSGVAPDAVYSDGTPPTTDAVLLATARRFVELLSGTSPFGLPPLSADHALAQLHARATTDLAHFCIDVLVDAIGLMPCGTPVEVNSGYRGVVVEAGPMPSQYDLPTVRLVVNARGERCEPITVALASNTDAARTHGPVMRVLGRPEPVVRVTQQEIAGPLYAWIERRKATEGTLRQWLVDEVFAREAASARDALPVGEPTARGGGDARHKAMGRRPEGPSGAFDAGPTTVRRLERRSAAAEEFHQRTTSGGHATVAAWTRATSSSSVAVVEPARGPSGSHEVRTGPVAATTRTAQFTPQAPAWATPPADDAAPPSPAAPHPPAAPAAMEPRAPAQTPHASAALPATTAQPALGPPPDPAAFDEAPLSAATGIRRLPNRSGAHRTVGDSQSTAGPAAPGGDALAVPNTDAPTETPQPAEPAPGSVRDYLQALKSRSGSTPAVGADPAPHADGRPPASTLRDDQPTPVGGVPKLLDVGVPGVDSMPPAFVPAPLIVAPSVAPPTASPPARPASTQPAPSPPAAPAVDATVPLPAAGILRRSGTHRTVPRTVDDEGQSG